MSEIPDYMPDWLGREVESQSDNYVTSVIKTFPTGSDAGLQGPAGTNTVDFYITANPGDEIIEVALVFLEQSDGAVS